MDEGSSDVFEVEAILDCRILRDNVLYYVKWVGSDELTWEPEPNLYGCPELLEQFWSEKQRMNNGNNSVKKTKTQKVPDASKNEIQQSIFSDPEQQIQRSGSTSETEIQQSTTASDKEIQQPTSASDDEIRQSTTTSDKEIQQPTSTSDDEVRQSTTTSDKEIQSSTTTSDNETSGEEVQSSTPDKETQESTQITDDGIQQSTTTSDEETQQEMLFRLVYVVIPRFNLNERTEPELPTPPVDDDDGRENQSSKDIEEEDEDEEEDAHDVKKTPEFSVPRERVTSEESSDEDSDSQDLTLMSNVRLSMYLKEKQGFDRSNTEYSGSFDWPTRRACIDAIMKGTDNPMFEPVEQMLEDMNVATFRSFLGAILDPNSEYTSSEEFFNDLNLKMNEVVGLLGREADASLCLLTIVGDVQKHAQSITQKTPKEKRTEAIRSLKEQIESIIEGLPDDLGTFMKAIKAEKPVRKRLPKFRREIDTQAMGNQEKSALSAAMESLNDQGPPAEMSLYGSLMRDVERAGTPVVRASYDLLGFNADEICQGTASLLISKIKAFRSLY